jgi:hypothetical protein
MKNTPDRRISTLTASILILIAPMTLGVHSMLPVDNTALPEILPSAEARLKPLMLAENKNTMAEDNTQTAVDEDSSEKKPESGSEADNEDPSAKSKTVPLKSFRPSEEIAAEQAVDFPVDI